MSKKGKKHCRNIDFYLFSPIAFKEEVIVHFGTVVGTR
jgi:hypothetical protein